MQCIASNEKSPPTTDTTLLNNIKWRREDGTLLWMLSHNSENTVRVECLSTNFSLPRHFWTLEYCLILKCLTLAVTFHPFSATIKRKN